MKFNRIISSLLIFALLTLSAVSCADKTAADAPADTTANEGETAAETETELSDGLPDMDYESTTFNILARTSRLDQYYTEELTGDVVDDAIYQRNAVVEDRFNIKLGFTDIADDGGLWSRTIEGSVASGDGAYDLVMPDYWWGCETAGYFLDLYSFEHLDFTAPWWWQGWNQNVQIKGKLYNAVGDYSVDRVKNTELILFNKALAEQFNINDLYTLVREGKWTIDKMTEFCDIAASDINGDSKMTAAADRFGAGAALHAGRGLMYSIGMKVITTDNAGNYIMGFTDEQFVNIYNKSYSFFNKTNSVCYGGNLDQMFQNDMLLFFMVEMGATERLRTMDTDFGIIPVPKYDEAQENYISSNLGTAYFSIVLTARDTEMSSIILEALNFESYKTVRPVYYDIAVKGKFSRDVESEEMLDIIIDNCYIDFAFVNTAYLGGIAEAVFSQVESKKEDISSFVASKTKVTEKLLDKMLDIYEQNYGG